LVLDSNEYILGIPADKASCAKLMDQLLSRSELVAFEIVNAETALSLLQV